MIPPPVSTLARISVLLVDDHLMFREHLRDLIARDGTMVVFGEAQSASGAFELMRQGTPDVAVVDITLRGANGLDLVSQLSREAPEVKVLVLTMHDESLYGERARQARARGYLTKNQASAEVIRAIRGIMAGELCFGSGAADDGTGDAEDGALSQGELSAVDSLATRELEVFALLGSGKGTREIAQALQIGESTVETYRSRIKEKLGLRSAAELYVTAGNWLREHGSTS